MLGFNKISNNKFSIDENTILLIDGSSFIFRAFHAIPELTAPNGKPTNATYGVINMLKQLKKRVPTKHIACVFDAPGKNFRDKIYPEYKATRRETPDNLKPQFADIYALVKALGIPLIMQEGIEADDIIGTIARHAQKNQKKVLIATGDKDFAQLVDDDIILINTMTDEVLDHQGVITKFGVEPRQIIDYLSLIGDKVDNVPGVEKCGPKTAVKWLSEYITLDNLIANKDKITGVVGDNLRNTVDWLPTAQKLITIDTNLDLNILNVANIDKLVYQDPDIAILASAFKELGFKTWLKELVSSNTLEVAATFTGNDLVNTALKIKPEILLNEIVTIDSQEFLEKLFVNILSSQKMVVLLALGNAYPDPGFVQYYLLSYENTTYIINGVATHTHVEEDLFSTNPDTSSNYNPYVEIAKLLASDTPKLFINYKEFLELWVNCNSENSLKLNQVFGDLTLLHYVQNSKLKHICSAIYQDAIDLEVIDLPVINGKYTKDSIWYGDFKFEGLVEDLNKIMSNALSVHQNLQTGLTHTESEIYQNIELPLASILVEIERVGIKLDTAQFKLIENALTERLKVLEELIYQDSKVVFNINSPKQLQDVLFTTMQLPTFKIKKNNNNYSTDEESLKILEEEGIIIATHLLEYRALSKLLNTYVTKLPLLVDNKERLHTTFEQALVASGRLSSNNPNLQNIPIKSEWGKKIRRAFVAKDGYQLISADYSQIELRILAHISQDENLLNAFNTNQDVHTKTACDIFHKTPENVTKDERRYAKTINFSLLYGKTVFGLAQELNIDRVTAKSYIDAYFAKYPKVMDSLNGLKEFGHTNGYVETVMGRRIYLPNINASNRMLREAEERLALNAPMQGTSADIIKVAMCNLNKWLKDNNLNTKIILQVHDELVLEVPDSEVEIVSANIANIMANAVNLSVTLGVDVKIASNWDEAH